MRLSIFVRITSCRSATISKRPSSELSFSTPFSPLCRPVKSGETNSKASIPLKKGCKKAGVSTTICASGYCLRNAPTTGTLIATSPIAERRMTRIRIGADTEREAINLFCRVENGIQFGIVVHLHLLVHLHVFVPGSHTASNSSIAVVRSVRCCSRISSLRRHSSTCFADTSVRFTSWAM